MTDAVRIPGVAAKVRKARRRTPRYEEPDNIPGIFKAMSVIGFVILLAPAVIVFSAALTAGQYLTFPPQGLSFRWIIEFFASDVFRGAFFTSFILALVVTAISTTLGTMISIFLTRVGFAGRGAVRALFVSPIMVPGVVIGLALFLYYIFLDIGLSRSFPGMLLGHIIVTVPWVIVAVTAALYHFDRSIEDAARSLGAGPFKAFRLVTLPNISQGIMAGSVFAFIVSFGQFDVSLFLGTSTVQPLPIAIFLSLRHRPEPTTAAAGAIAIILVVVSMILVSRLMNLNRIMSARRAE